MDILKTTAIVLAMLFVSGGAFASEQGSCAVGYHEETSKSNSAARGSIYDMAGHSTTVCVANVS